MWETQHWFLFKTSGLYFISRNIYHMLKQFAITWFWWNSGGGSEVKSLSSSLLREGLKGSMRYFHKRRIKTESRCLNHCSQPGRLATLRTHSVTWHCSHNVDGPRPLQGGRRGRACTCLFWSTCDTQVRHLTKSCRWNFCNYLLSLCDYRDIVVAVVQTGKNEM